MLPSIRCPRSGEGPRPLAPGNCSSGCSLCAMRAGLGLRSSVRRLRRLVEWVILPSLLRIRPCRCPPGCRVMDDPSTNRAVLEHRVTRALGDHLGYLRDAFGDLASSSWRDAYDQRGKCEHRHRQGDRQVHPDLELEGLRTHGLLQLSGISDGRPIAFAWGKRWAPRERVVWETTEPALGPRRLALLQPAIDRRQSGRRRDSRVPASVSGAPASGARRAAPAVQIDK